MQRKRWALLAVVVWEKLRLVEVAQFALVVVVVLVGVAQVAGRRLSSLDGA